MGLDGFRPGKALTVQAGAALVVVLSLAAWQFGRGLDKTALANERAERLRAEPVSAATLRADSPDFVRVALVGEYDPERQFFVAGRQPGGVEAWSVLDTSDGAFLVNRGWLADPAAPPTGEVSAVGVLWPSVSVTVYASQQAWPDGWPKEVRWADPQRMAAVADAHPREIRLERGSDGVSNPASLAWDYSAGTHWGYTAQWLLIGAAVVGGYIVIGLRRGRNGGG
ncbi:MAG: SURF1 family protein [Gammaproteobacteria bacterium]|nr:SURF1 family protein [Gammaproteobacteria bacterium]